MDDGRFVTSRLLDDHPEGFLVWNYINQDTREWKLDSLQVTFDGPNVEHILAIPLPPKKGEDRLIVI